MTAAIDGALARTKPGSRAHGHVCRIGLFVRANARGISFAEFALATAEDDAQSSALGAEFFSLVRRGILEAVGGRTGHTLYAPHGSGLQDREVATPGGEDEALVVLDALRAGYGRLGRSLTTREVAQEMRSRGDTLRSSDVNAVRKRLETLSSKRTRGFAVRRQPLVLHQRSRSLGRGLTSYWRPIEDNTRAASGGPREDNAADDTPIHAASEAEAVRRCVGHPMLLLQRPVTRQEIRWWLRFEQSRDDPIRLMPPDRVTTALAVSVPQDSRRGNANGLLREVTTRWTAFGGAPPRYSVLPWSSDTHVVLAVEDAMYAWAIAREWQGIRQLDRLASRRRSQILGHIAEFRRVTLLWHFSSLIGPCDPESVPSTLRGHLITLNEWVTSGEVRNERWATHARRVLTARMRNVDAIVDIVRAVSGVPPESGLRQPRIAGEAATVATATIDALVANVARVRRETPQRVMRYMQSARRFPVPGASRELGVSGSSPSPLAVVDRQDALIALAVTPMPRARTLMTNAVSVTGWFVRDASLWCEILTGLDRGDGFTRRALTVACGLLGTSVPFADAVPDCTGAADIAAWVFSTTMADPENAVERLREAKEFVHPQHRRHIEQAIMRVRLGYLWSCVE